MNLQEELSKKYKREILVLGSQIVGEERVSYPTGAVSLDIATGIGGLPGGRITEIFGLPFGGKTSLSLACISQLHKNKPNSFAAFIDAESSLDLDYAVRCGIDISRLYISRPEYAEQALDIIEHLIRNGTIDIIVLDSIPALSPRAEVEGDVGDAHIGLIPRLMSQFLRRTAFAIRESGVSLILINQIRDKIGRLSFPILETPGGYAIKHHTSMRISLRNAGELKTGDGVAYGSTIDFVVKKNKVGNPYGVGSFEIWGDRGVCKEAGLLDLALEKGIVIQSGSWFKYKDKIIGQGRMNAIQELSNLELKLEIEKEVFSG